MLTMLRAGECHSSCDWSRASRRRARRWTLTRPSVRNYGQLMDRRGWRLADKPIGLRKIERIRPLVVLSCRPEFWAKEEAVLPEALASGAKAHPTRALPAMRALPPLLAWLRSRPLPASAARTQAPLEESQDMVSILRRPTLICKITQINELAASSSTSSTCSRKIARTYRPERNQKIR